MVVQGRRHKRGWRWERGGGEYTAYGGNCRQVEVLQDLGGEGICFLRRFAELMCIILLSVN